jgi:maleylacetoacetate isomerase
VKLYSYFRSSSAYRVRIALNLKQIKYEVIPVHLLKEGGEQNNQSYKTINPMSQVPTLIHESFVLTQSMAILTFLDEMKPERVPLFSSHPEKRAKIVEFCEVINSGIQPLQNLSLLQFMQEKASFSSEDKLKWGSDVIDKGFVQLENLLKKSKQGDFCFGNEVTAAECFLIPQIYNARRFQVDMENYKLLTEIENNCLKLKPFIEAMPENQIDCPDELRIK